MKECEVCHRTTDQYYEENKFVCKDCYICTKCKVLKEPSSFLTGFDHHMKNNICQECIYKEAVIITSGYDTPRYEYLEGLVNKCTDDDREMLKDILSVKVFTENKSTAVSLQTKEPSNEIQIHSVYNQINYIYIQIQSLTRQIQTSSLQLKAIHIQINSLLTQLSEILTKTKNIKAPCEYIHSQLSAIYIQMQSTNAQIEALAIQNDGVFIQVKCIFQQLENLMLLIEAYLGVENTSPTDFSDIKPLSDKTKYSIKTCTTCQKEYPQEIGKEWKQHCNECYNRQSFRVRLPVDQFKNMSKEELGDLPLCWGKKYFHTKMSAIPDDFYVRMANNLDISNFDSNDFPHIYYYMTKVKGFR